MAEKLRQKPKVEGTPAAEQLPIPNELPKLTDAELEELQKGEEVVLLMIPEAQRKAFRAQLIGKDPRERFEKMKALRQYWQQTPADEQNLEKLRQQIRELTQSAERQGFKVNEANLSRVENTIAAARAKLLGKQLEGGIPNSTTLYQQLANSIQGIELIEPIQLYSESWETRWRMQLAFTVLDAAILSIVAQYSLAAMFPGIHIGFGTPWHIGSYLTALGIVGATNMNTLETKLLAPLAEGTRPKFRKGVGGKALQSGGLLLRGALLGSTLWATTGSYVEVGSDMYQSKVDSKKIAIPAKKFRGDVEAQRIRMKEYAGASPLIDDFALQMESGKWLYNTNASGEKVLVGFAPWTEKEIEPMATELAGKLRDAGYTDDEIHLYTSIRGSGKEGIARNWLFKYRLITGKFNNTPDEIKEVKSTIRASLATKVGGDIKKVNESEVDAQFTKYEVDTKPAEDARKKAGLQPGESRGAAMLRIVNQFVGDPDRNIPGDPHMEALMTDTGQIDAIAQQIKEQGEDPLDVLLRAFVLGAAPEDIKAMQPIMEYMAQQSSVIEKSSNEKVTIPLELMNRILSDSIKNAGVGGAIQYKAPAGLDVKKELEILDPIQVLVQQTSQRTAAEAAAFAQLALSNNILDRMQVAWSRADERFGVNDKKISNDAELMRDLVGNRTAEQVHKYGVADAWALSLFLAFFVTGCSAAGIYKNGKRMRGAEEKNRDPLFETERKLADQWAATLNVGLQQVFDKKRGQRPEMEISSDMVLVAARVVRDRRNPLLAGTASARKHIKAGFGHAVERGPVPDKVQRFQALRDILEMMQDTEDPTIPREIIDVILPGYGDLLDIANSLQHDKIGDKGLLGRGLSNNKRQLYEVLEKHYADYVRIGHKKFLIGLLEAEQRAFDEVREEIPLAENDQQRKAIEKQLSIPRDMIRSAEDTGMLTSFANYLGASAVLQRENIHIHGYLNALRHQLQAAERRFLEDTQDLQIARGNRKRSSPNLTIRTPAAPDPYSVFAAVRDGVRRRLKERLAEVTDNPEFIKQKWNAMRAVVERRMTNFEQQNPGYAAYVNHVFNPVHSRMEFRLKVVKKGTQETILESMREDDLFDPSFRRAKGKKAEDPIAASAHRLDSWLKSELQNKGEAQAVAHELMSKLASEDRPSNRKPIQLSGGDQDSLLENATKSLDSYYKDVKAEAERRLASTLVGKVMTREEFEQQKAILEKNALNNAGVLPQDRVVDILKEIISNQRASDWKVTYDLKDHTVIVTPSSRVARVIFPRRTKSIRIEQYNSKQFNDVLGGTS